MLHKDLPHQSTEHTHTHTHTHYSHVTSSPFSLPIAEGDSHCYSYGQATAIKQGAGERVQYGTENPKCGVTPSKQEHSTVPHADALFLRRQCLWVIVHGLGADCVSTQGPRHWGQARVGHRMHGLFIAGGYTAVCTPGPHLAAAFALRLQCCVHRFVAAQSWG